MYVRDLFAAVRSRRRVLANRGARAGRGARHRKPPALAVPLLALPVLLGLTPGCASGDDGTGDGDRHALGNSGGPDSGEADGAAPAADPRLWVDPRSPAARQVREWEAQGRTADARVLRRLADQPIAEWPSAEEDPGPRVAEVARAAEAERRTAVFVAYNVPHRDCGQYSQGGAENADAYRRWLDSFADGIGDADAVVILEPDAVPHIADGCTDGMYHEERYQVLSEAVDRLKELPGTRVYIDAGNPSWITDPGVLTEPLWRSGLAHADGFALNVSNYQTTEAVSAYGRRLSELLDGAHFVVDTSRNGNGPLAEGRAEEWCNPPGRGLGVPPTTETGDPLIDAYLWVKRPGESDGECRGGPRAGEWWADYALGLARRAQAP
jgi:endoglucanase